MERDFRTKKYRVAVVLSHPIHYLTALCRELAARPEIELTVYFCSDFGLRPGYDATFGRTVTWYDARMLDGFAYRYLPRWFKKDASPSGFWGVVNPRIVPEIVRGRYDAVMIHGYTHCTNWLAVIAAKLSGTAVLLRGESNLLQSRPLVVRAAKRIVLSVLFGMADAFLPIGELNARFYARYGIGKERLFPAPYAVDNAMLQAEHTRLLPAREDIRRSLGVQGDSPVILFVSKLIARKRPMDLLRAYEKLTADRMKTREQENMKAPHLVFVGDGPERASLEQYTQEHKIRGVRFEGFKRPDETAPYFAAADIFAFPSGFETWGLVVNEAMNFGLPVVTTGMVGSSADLVKDGETGFVCAVTDVNGMTERLKLLAGDAALRRAMGERARARIAEWSNRAAADGILQALRSL